MDAYEKFKRLPAHIQLVSTSVQDVKCSLQFIDDPVVINNALAYEKEHLNRSSIVKMLSGKLKKLNKDASA